MMTISYQLSVHSIPRVTLFWLMLRIWTSYYTSPSKRIIGYIVNVTLCGWSGTGA